ncbi:ferritin-like domain-containing protein [Flavobacterium sp. MK4S-17]|uniref:ferritin-like domain-containing protein n=1 Tax=Flavobacterium sp. MK4S-17 TaxID=2543737 RepID=UPI00135ADCE0|nr:ferritin-like domain-containing protein [Flavobacterium sp. MK4S-17]
MNIIKFIESFTNESFLNSKSSRRDSFGQFGTVGKNAAMAAIPFGLATFLAPQKSSAASTTFFGPQETPIEALQLALILEYLEDEFYATALATTGLIPSAHQTIFTQIAKHEKDHVEFLVSQLGDAAPARPTFDFTGGQGNPGGPFNPFGDYDTFLALSQAFEDTGVRAYKGQAGNLLGQPALLKAALQIHSVEARHASQVRRLRMEKGWIEGDDRGGLPEAAQAVYDGEDNSMQLFFNTSSVSGIPSAAGPESFDEPLTGAQATSIASLFIVP